MDFLRSSSGLACACYRFKNLVSDEDGKADAVLPGVNSHWIISLSASPIP